MIDNIYILFIYVVDPEYKLIKLSTLHVSGFYAVDRNYPQAYNFCFFEMYLWPYFFCQKHILALFIPRKVYYSKCIFQSIIYFITGLKFQKLILELKAKGKTLWLPGYPAILATWVPSFVKYLWVVLGVSSVCVM
jgi:hypothetical protein